MIECTLEYHEILTRASRSNTGTLQDEVVAFDGISGQTFVEHIPPSTEGGDLLILTFNSTAFLRSPSEYVSSGNTFLRLEERKGSPCSITEDHLECGTCDSISSPHNCNSIYKYHFYFQKYPKALDWLPHSTSLRNTRLHSGTAQRLIFSNLIPSAMPTRIS